MPGINVRDGGVWKNIPNGTKFNVRDGGVWKNPSKVYLRHGGSWVEVWTKSEPITYTLPVTATETMGRAATFMEWNPAGTANFAFVGAFSGSYDRVGCYTFNTSGFATALATRPVVKSAFFTTQRDSSSGSSAATGTIFLGLYTGAFNSGTPDYNLLDFSPTASLSWDALNPLGFSQVHQWTLGTSFGQDLANHLVSGTGVLAMSARTSGWDSTKPTDSIYSKWRGPLTGYTGQLQITLDYI
jgi:hypothetical protein